MMKYRLSVTMEKYDDVNQRKQSLCKRTSGGKYVTETFSTE